MKVIYRCGWCGNFIDKLGRVLDEKEWNEAQKAINEDDDVQAELGNGECCKHEFNY